MDCIILIIKGFVIGIAKIIPGVSGALLAISLGLYEKAMDALAHFWKHPKRYLSFLFCLGFGVMLAIVFGSHAIKFLLHHWYLPTMLFFIGLMAGGFPSFYRAISHKASQKKYIFIVVLSFLLVLFFSFQFRYVSEKTLENVSWGWLFFMGLLEMATTIIPGISGTAIFMLLGSYSLILELFSMLSSLSLMGKYLNLYIPFGVGIILGLFLVAKSMDYLFRHHYYGSHFAILGLSLGSVITLFIQTFQRNYSVIEVLLSLVLLVLGYRIAQFFPESNHNENLDS